jgi:hypothetical protein
MLDINLRGFKNKNGSENGKTAEVLSIDNPLTP